MNNINQKLTEQQHASELKNIIELVENRGGPKESWTIDLVKHTASLRNVLNLSFYELKSGSFSLATLRKNPALDEFTEQNLIQDAVYCIAKEINKKTGYDFKKSA